MRALCDALRETVGRADAPILIDQEGGRVQRMGPPHWPKYPSGRAYGRLHANDPLVRRELTRLGARLIAHDLRAVGINVDCLPVLDVPVAGRPRRHRRPRLRRDPQQVAVLGRAAAEGLLAGGVLPVIKHMPGHGRAGADSHLPLPVVEAAAEELEAHDFAPFRMLADMPLAMTAHVVYAALDPEQPGHHLAAGHGRGDPRPYRLRRPRHERRPVHAGPVRLLPRAGRGGASRPAATWPSTATAAWTR